MTSLTQTSNLMNKKAHGWIKDRNAILLLFLLNIIQGLPQGLFNLTIPITLMEKGATYHNLIIICLSYIPFCLKCFLSPVLNTYYSRRFGKGKTYLVPAYYILGITMLVLASKGEKILELESIPFLSVLSVVIMSILTVSDICLDGWMVNFISKENSSFAPVCQTIGLNIGSFISFNLFLPLNSLDFCNTFIYSTPQKTPVLGAQSFITILAGFILMAALLIHIFLVEEETEYHKPSSITEVLRTVTIFVTNSHFRKILMLFTTWNLIFGPIHNLFTSLLLQKGVSKEMVTNLNAPIPIFIFFFSMWAGALCKKYSAIKVLNGSWLVRLVAAFILYGTVVYLEIIPDAIRVPLFFLCLLLGAITYTAVAIAMGAFSSYVAQETFGGPILSTFGAIGNVGRLVADMFSLFSLKYVSWDNLAISSLVGMLFYAIIFVKGMSSFENKNFRRLIGEKEKSQ